MQLKTALPPSQVSRCVAAVSRRALSPSVGFASCRGWQTPRALRASVPSRRVESQSMVRAPRGSAAPGNQFVAVLATAATASSHICGLPAKVPCAACPAWSAQAPRSTARCPSSAALPARRGHSHSQRVLLSPACFVASTRFAIGVGKLTVMNASHFVGCGTAKSAPNPSVKRTCPGVPWHAAYLKR